MIIDNMTYRSPDYRSNARSCGVDMLVFHSTETSSLSETAKCFISEQERNVSCHYVVDRDGRIYQFVPEGRAANHAGKSSWRAVTGEEVTNINARSIGIEFQRGAGETFTPAQIQAGLCLSKNITNRYGISPNNVVAHSDVAPDRKSDPGNDFPWELFAQNGIAANASRRGGDGRAIGYDPNLIAAAQRGAFNVQNLETDKKADLLAQVQQKSSDKKTKTDFPKEGGKDVIGTLLKTGLSLLSGSSDGIVAGIATLASASDNLPAGDEAPSKTTTSGGLLPTLALGSDGFLDDTPLGNLISGVGKITGKDV